MNVDVDARKSVEHLDTKTVIKTSKCFSVLFTV